MGVEDETVTPRLIRFRTWSKVWDTAEVAALDKRDPYPSVLTRYDPVTLQLTEEGLRLHQEWGARRPVALEAIAKWRMIYPKGFSYDDAGIMWGYPDNDYAHGVDTTVEAPPNRVIVMQDTGFVDGATNQPIYEGDIVSFTIRGATHGREPDFCRAAHVWWDPKWGCWAFGRWPWTHTGAPASDWWYTASDDGFDHASLRVLGNVWEHPELVAQLGYTP